MSVESLSDAEHACAKYKLKLRIYCYKQELCARHLSKFSFIINPIVLVVFTVFSTLSYFQLYTVRSESRCALRLRYVDLVSSIEARLMS
jgi:hypothetical protein